MISLQQISKRYDSASGTVEALRQTNLEVPTGQHVAIVGKSGSGKSTLLNLIAGLDRPTAGSLVVGGVALNALSERELAAWRGHHVGIVFQFYQLIPTLSALDNVRFAMNLVNKLPKADRTARAESLLEEVGLADKLRKFPHELSGGQRQRVAIARALANDPQLLIADEPTGNLDSKTGGQIEALFARVHAQGTTVVTVTHARIEGKGYDAVWHIEDGTLCDPELPNPVLL
ncbi:MAG: ABC transporter ATP-binding protein [Bacteroidota bacterium]